MKLTKFLSNTIPKWMGSITSIVVHTLFFVGIFLLMFTGMKVEMIMLILTTVVSLEAIYLSLFIQLTVNKQGESLENVEGDIDELQKDVEDIGEDVEDITEDKEDEDDEMLLKIKSLDKIGSDLAKLAKDVNFLRATIESTNKKK